jgi:hypothetical protein
MGKKRTLIIVGLALATLATGVYLTTTLTSLAKDRPTLMYFRADL